MTCAAEVRWGVFLLFCVLCRVRQGEDKNKLILVYTKKKYYQYYEKK